MKGFWIGLVPGLAVALGAGYWFHQHSAASAGAPIAAAVRPGDPQAKPVVSLVLLQKSPRVLDAVQLGAAAAAAWPDTVADDGPRCEVEGVAPLFLVHLGEAVFQVHVSGQRYDDAAALPGARDARVSAAFAVHSAWVGIDLDEAAGPLDAAAAYGRAARLAAQLADAGTLAVYAPETRQALAFDEDARRLLAVGLPAALLQAQAPLDVAEDDPAMAAAEAEARRHFPEFAAAFARRTDGQKFTLRARFTEGDQAEVLEITPTLVSADAVEGALESSPAFVKSLAAGQHVRCPLSDISDWQFEDAAGAHGGFTLPVLHDLELRQAH